MGFGLALLVELIPEEAVVRTGFYKVPDGQYMSLNLNPSWRSCRETVFASLNNHQMESSTFTPFDKTTLNSSPDLLAYLQIAR